MIFSSWHTLKCRLTNSLIQDSIAANWLLRWELPWLASTLTRAYKSLTDSFDCFPDSFSIHCWAKAWIISYGSSGSNLEGKFHQFKTFTYIAFKYTRLNVHLKWSLLNYLEVFMLFKMPLSPEAQCMTK